MAGFRAEDVEATSLAAGPSGRRLSDERLTDPLFKAAVLLRAAAPALLLPSAVEGVRGISSKTVNCLEMNPLGQRTEMTKSIKGSKIRSLLTMRRYMPSCSSVKTSKIKPV